MGRDRKTNLDIRGYAALKGITLGDIAGHIGVSRSYFSTAYMAFELPEDRKIQLIRIIDEMVMERRKHEQTN